MLVSLEKILRFTLHHLIVFHKRVIAVVVDSALFIAHPSSV